MSDALFWPSGGSLVGPVKKGTIVVSYPPGAICTVSNGSKTYKALDTSGAAAFVFDPGTWTVRIEDGSKSREKTVAVEAGRWADVQLAFEVILFDGASGGDNSALTGGWSVNNQNLAKVSAETLKASLSNDGAVERRGELTTINAVDLTGREKIFVTIDEGSGDYGFVSLVNGAAVAATQTRLAAGTHSMDIPSGLTEANIRVGIGTRLLGANTQYSSFTRIWLE